RGAEEAFELPEERLLVSPARSEVHARQFRKPCGGDVLGEIARALFERYRRDTSVHDERGDSDRGQDVADVQIEGGEQVGGYGRRAVAMPGASRGAHALVVARARMRELRRVRHPFEVSPVFDDRLQSRLRLHAGPEPGRVRASGVTGLRVEQDQPGGAL